MLDRVLVEFTKAAGVEIIVHCEGDRHIDDHHTAEDVAITLGQCLHEALGEKVVVLRCVWDFRAIFREFVWRTPIFSCRPATKTPNAP